MAVRPCCASLKYIPNRWTTGWEMFVFHFLSSCQWPSLLHTVETVTSNPRDYPKYNQIQLTYTAGHHRLSCNWVSWGQNIWTNIWFLRPKTAWGPLVKLLRAFTRWFNRRISSHIRGDVIELVRNQTSSRSRRVPTFFFFFLPLLWLFSTDCCVWQKSHDEATS